MGYSVRHVSFKWLLATVFALNLGCSAKDLTYQLSSTDSLSGSIANFSAASFKVGSLDACRSEKVSLYSLTAGGQKDSKLVDGSVDANGKFTLSGLREKGIDLKKKDSTRYLLEFSCGSALYQRFVTGQEQQNLSEASSILAWVAQTAASSQIARQSPETWSDFYQQLGSANDTTEAFTTLSANGPLKSKFESTFGISVTDLLNATPKIQSSAVPSALHEGVSQAVSVVSMHWSASYNQAYLWKIGSQILSRASSFNYTPGANMQGSQNLQLFIGRDDGGGNLDMTKPYMQETFAITVANDLPATPPAVSRLSAQFTSSTTAQLRLATGAVTDGRAVNCQSFSKMALTEEAYPGVGIAPLLFSSYTLDCTQSPTQDINFTLSGTEGRRVIRLWAIDQANNYSLTSSNIDLYYDVTSPQVTLSSLNSAESLRGGAPYAITWTTTEANPAVNPIKLEYSLNNGSSWVSIVNATADSGSYSWAPLNTINSTQMLVRVTMTDLIGQTGTAASATNFTVDSTAPLAPALSAPAYTNTLAINVGMTCVADHYQVFIKNSNSAPLLSDSGWQNCAAFLAHTLPSGDGIKTVYVWARDAVGNISSSPTTVSVELDQTAPSVALTSLTGGQIVSGNTGHTPAINVQNITWTASDANSGLATNPVRLDYSVDAGTTWLPIASSLANSGTYAWTVPVLDTNTVRVRVGAIDKAGTTGYAQSATNFTVDSTRPLISSLATTQTSPVGTPFVNVLTTVSDTTTVTHIQVRDGVNTAASNLWIPYAANQPFSFSFTQGAHTIYVFVKDQAGNISLASSVSMTLDSGTPPTIAILGPAEGTALSPPTAFTLSVHIHDNEDTMPTGGVQIEYSLDNKTTWTTLDAAASLYRESTTLATETFTYTWTPVPAAVTGKSVIFRISAKDKAGNMISRLSPIYNVTGLRTIAGGITDANNVSALFTILNTKQYFDTTRLSNLVRNPNTNEFFIGDDVQGLRYVNGSTGMISLAPKAGGAEVVSTARDNFGTVYGCNGNGIFTWNSSTKTWVTYLANACDRIAAHKTVANRIYFYRSNKLYYYDGTTVTWVAFNGTINSGSTAACYSLTPADPLAGCAPLQYNMFAVDALGNAWTADFCSNNGNVTGCVGRILVYELTTQKVHEEPVVTNGNARNILFRSSNNSILPIAMGLYDEDPLTGVLYYYSGGRVYQLPANQTFSTAANSFGTPTNLSGVQAVIAGVVLDSGDGGAATEAHINSPRYIVVGHPSGTQADKVYVPKGLSCCWDWAFAMRAIDPVSGLINLANINSVQYGRNGVNAQTASPSGGLVDFRAQQNFFADNTTTVLRGNTKTCNVSPTDGANAGTTNWPFYVSYDSNYNRGIHHTDGYIYVAGYRSTTVATTCSGTADIFIKRYTFNATTGAKGNVEHVAGVAGAPLASEPAAAGESPLTFAFGPQIIGMMRENLTSGAGGHIFFYQGNRIRMIKRVNPANINTWTIHDVTKNIGSIKSFTLDYNVNAAATSGYIYYVTDTSTIYRYNLGSGVVGDVSDDTITSITFGGITNLKISDIAIKSNGKLVFPDYQVNGTIYEYSP